MFDNFVYLSKQINTTIPCKFKNLMSKIFVYNDACKRREIVIEIVAGTEKICPAFLVFELITVL